MLLTIYDRYKQKRVDVSPDDNCTQVKEVQGENVLTLSFTLYEYVALDVNDYIDYLGERYWLMERYQPKQKSTVEWDYSVKFVGIESLIGRFLVLKTVDGEDEPIFSLTASPKEHLNLIIQAINNGMGNITDYKAGSVEGTENITIKYEGKYCDAALKELAEKVGTEYWFEGQTLNLCRCEYGEEVTLAYGKGLTELDKDTADNVKFYTRLFPIGSSRNINPEHYGYSRLQLPSKEKYVDVNTDKYGIHHHYEKDAFAEIYPRRVGRISSVRSEEVTGEDGTPFKIYYFKDYNLTFDPNEYELPGLVKRVTFQDGELAGQGLDEGENFYFEVNYHSDTREFEIITIWPKDNDMQLPNDTLIPEVGNQYVLWNISMPPEYYILAEEELATAVNKFNERNAVDVSRYKAPTDYIYIEENDIDLFIGRKVRLESAKFFPQKGYRNSRITKITRKINNPSQMDIEISDALSTDYKEAVGGEINDVKNYAKSIANSLSLPDIIRSWDNTLPTDNNLFSARRSQKEFLSKLKADRAKKKITFEEGADFGDYTAGHQGGTIDDKGNAELLSLVVRELLRSAKFVDGLTGEGFQLWIDEQGLANLTVDKMTARQVAVFFEMLIQKARSVGGQIVVSAANGKIKSVELIDGYYKITFEQENTFVAHDLMRAATFTGGALKSYWVEIAAVEGNSVLVAEEEFDTPPEAADECVLMGNTENPLRQSLISIAATEDGQPRIDVLDGVKEKTFSDCLRARLGNLDGISDSWFPADMQPKGNGLYGDNVFLRGEFILANSNIDVATKFEITDDNIKSAVGTLQNDTEHGKTILYNPSFTKGEDGWITSNVVVYYLTGEEPIYNNGQFIYNDAHETANPDYNNHRFILNIVNGYIKQLNDYFVNKPSISETNFVPVSISLKAMVEDDEENNILGGDLFVYFDDCVISDSKKATAFKGEISNDYASTGSINIKLPNGKRYVLNSIENDIDSDDVIAFDSEKLKIFNLTSKSIVECEVIEVDSFNDSDTIEVLSEAMVILGIDRLDASDDYITLEYISKWNGTGNFNLLFTGAISIYSLQLYSEPVEVRYATLFEQTDRLISLTAAIYDKDQSKLKETGLLVRPDKAGLFAVGNDGSYAQIGVYPEEGGKVVLSGEHIILEGNVTANNGLFVDDKGLVTMYNAKFLTEGEDRICLDLDNNGLVIKEDLENGDYEDMLRILVEKEVGYLKRNAPKIQLIKKVKTSDFQRQNILNLLANQINFTTSDYEYSDIEELGTRIRQSGLFVSVIEDGTTVQLMLAKGGSTGWDNTVTINPYSILTPDLNTGTLTLGGKQVVSITKDDIDYLILKKQ